MQVPPHNGQLLAPYRSYRWQKYVERRRADDFSNLWAPTARWIAQQAGPHVTRVQLVRTFRDVVTPGTTDLHRPAGEFTAYTFTAS
ncbi:MAG: hypothetical protein NVSMB55_11180 [Mycobacteriales bacterium]